LVDVSSFSIGVEWRVVVRLSVVIDLAEVANPPASVVNELNEGIRIGTTFLTANNCLLIEVCGRDLFSRRKLTERFDQNSEGDSTVFG